MVFSCILPAKLHASTSQRMHTHMQQILCSPQSFLWSPAWPCPLACSLESPIFLPHMHYFIVCFAWDLCAKLENRCLRGHGMWGEKHLWDRNRKWDMSWRWIKTINWMQVWRSYMKTGSDEISELEMRKKTWRCLTHIIYLYYPGLHVALVFIHIADH